jgi:hypothetical protein
MVLAAKDNVKVQRKKKKGRRKGGIDVENTFS